VAPRKSLALPVRQERSRQTRDRLLDAAEVVLARDGLEGATVPAIAAEAGVAVGSVYRRFPDKDALFRGVYQRFFTRGTETNRAGLTAEAFRGKGAAAVIARLVEGMVAGYRDHRSLLRALLLYEHAHADLAFRRHAAQLRAEAFRMIGDLLVARGRELSHPRPREAAAFALTVVRHTLQGLALQDGRGGALDDVRFVPELTRMVGAYLGVRSAPGPEAK
jgi:AcrR family transcriptional regulator